MVNIVCLVKKAEKKISTARCLSSHHTNLKFEVVVFLLPPSLHDFFHTFTQHAVDLYLHFSLSYSTGHGRQYLDKSGAPYSDEPMGRVERVSKFSIFFAYNNTSKLTDEYYLWAFRGNNNKVYSAATCTIRRVHVGIKVAFFGVEIVGG